MSDIEYWLTVTENERGWTQFYAKFMGQPLSTPTRFMKAVSTYGKKIMFDAVISSSTRSFDTDPLPYVLAVASRMFMQEADNITDESRYKMSLERAKQRSQIQNDELEAKMEKAREKYGNS